MNLLNFEARRTALHLSTAQLADCVGVSGAYIELAEREPLSDDVTFLLNLALSLLETEREASVAPRRIRERHHELSDLERVAV